MMKKFFMLIVVVVFLSACSPDVKNCTKINDLPETHSGRIGSAKIFRRNPNTRNDELWPFSWENDIELLFDMTPGIGLGQNSDPFHKGNSFYSDESHQWWICSESNGYFQAYLRKIND
jgi:hypothetical protein